MGVLLVEPRGSPSRAPQAFRALTRWCERLVGLLGTGPAALPVALVGCRSVHTWGMRYRIDVAIVSREGVVVRSVRALPPGRVVSARGAWIVLERPHARCRWYEVGEPLEIWMDGKEIVSCKNSKSGPVSDPAMSLE